MSTTQPPSTRKGKAPDRDAARRARLLATGLEVFGTSGYAASAIEDLCARAGVGTSSFYGEFSGKEALLRAVYDDVVARVGAALDAALAEEATDLPAYVERGVRAFVEATTADPRLVRVQVLEVVGVSPALEEHRREVLHAFARRLRGVAGHLRAQGIPATELDHLAALGLVGAANELLIEWATHRPALDAEDVVRALVRLHTAAFSA